MSMPNQDHFTELPIKARQAEILAAIDANQVTIITAETGAGKSTQVPQYLAEAGYDKVVVTQPRILAARNLSERVRQEMSLSRGIDATSLVGYRTASERSDDPENIILYCTDGLQLVRELTGSGTSTKQILILDEVHEWNENMEVLVAWSKKRCAEDPNFKLVLMSATIDAADLASYFKTPGIISVVGKTYPVEKHHGENLVNEIITEVQNRVSNILVFLPGKAEIELVTAALRSRLPRPVRILPLHGQLEPAVQQLVFENYPEGKIILSTNVAQTSITIDDIDMVIDSGLERRSEVRNGVEGLFIGDISKSDCLQRAGRAGRTRPGTYVLAKYDSLPCPSLEERSSYGIPEIMRKHIDRVVLRLAAINIDIESLEFYHSPSRKIIKQAKRTLISLGALTNAGQITDTGRQMERFPVESSYARMLVESKNFSLSVQTKLASIIAIQEVGGIVKTSARFTGWRQLTKVSNSDLLAQYDVFLRITDLDPAYLDELGVISRNVEKATDVAGRLHRDLGLIDVSPDPVSPTEEKQLLKCIVAGQLHQLWALEINGEAIHLVTKRKREVSSGTVVKQAKVIAARPFDLEVATPKGLETLHLVTDITAVDPKWLSDLAPSTYQVTPGKVYFDPNYGSLAARTVIKTHGRTFQSASTPMLARTPEDQHRFLQLYSSWIHDRVISQRKSLELYSSRRIPDVSIEEVEDRVKAIIGHAVSVHELPKPERIELEKLSKLDTYLGRDYRVIPSLTAERAVKKHQGRRTGWKQPGKRGRKSGRG